jgi:O-antigen ligase
MMSLANTGNCNQGIWPIFSWLVFMLFSTILIFDRAVYNLLALLIVCLASSVIILHGRLWDAEVKILALVLLANILLAIPNLILGHDDLMSLENPLRMLLMIPLLLAVKRCGLSARFICTGLAIGMLMTSLVVSWQYFVQDVERPGIHYNPILFSEIAMSAFAILLAAWLIFKGRVSILYLFGLLASLYCVVLSGARGSLIALVPILVVWLFWEWGSGAYRGFWRSQRAFLLLVILLFMGILLASSEYVLDRGHLAVSQISDYFERAEASTSVGLRLEMWRGAILAAAEQPLLGIGDQHIFVIGKVLSGELEPDVLIMRHAHSDYFGALMSRGVPGLILQLLIYAVPLYIFLRGLWQEKGDKLFAALAGTLMIVAYMAFSLTEVPMYNGLPLIFFIIMTSLLIGILRHTHDPTDADNSR